jgi:hypothetical protein
MDCCDLLDTAPKDENAADGEIPLPHADCWRDHDVPTRIPHSIGSCLMKQDQSAVFVVDDDESVRTAVARALPTVGLEVASFGPTPRIPPEQAPHAPGCTVIDVTLPGTSGIAFAARTAEIEY